MRELRIPALQINQGSARKIYSFGIDGKLLHRFAAVGRMALTNYLLQSFVGTLIFYGYGLGFFGVGPALLIPLTFVMFIAQLYASPWWLARYRFGPVEWLWRRLTYKGKLPMRREAVVAAPEQVPA